MTSEFVKKKKQHLCGTAAVEVFSCFIFCSVYLTDIVHTSNRNSTDITQTSYRNNTNIIQTSYRNHVHILQKLYRYTNILQKWYNPEDTVQTMSLVCVVQGVCLCFHFLFCTSASYIFVSEVCHRVW